MVFLTNSSLPQKRVSLDFPTVILLISAIISTRISIMKRSPKQKWKRWLRICRMSVRNVSVKADRWFRWHFRFRYWHAAVISQWVNVPIWPIRGTDVDIRCHPECGTALSDHFWTSGGFSKRLVALCSCIVERAGCLLRKQLFSFYTIHSVWMRMAHQG